MPSTVNLRDAALAKLTHAEQAELLRLGAAARLADDDFVWILFSAVVRLDMDRFTRIAGDYSRSRADEGIAQIVERAAERITDVTRYAVRGARWDRPAHRLALVAVTALVLLVTHLTVFVIAERGWIGYLSGEIAELKEVREELRINPPPAWLTWSADASGNSAAFVERTPSQVDVRQCQLAGQPGTCIFTK
jgi:hypothetical protein